MRIFQEIKGFTLIELLVTLGLLGLVIAGGFSYYYFADRAFMSGSLVADVQADMQIAMRRITEEVRLAHSLVITDNVDYDEDDPDDLHILYEEKGSIFLKTKRQNRLILQGDPEEGFRMHFSRVTQNGDKLENMLAITLTSQHPHVDYELKSELQILNLRLGGVEGDVSGKTIRFTKSFSEEELEMAERINPGCIYRRRIYSSGAPELDSLRQFRDNYLAKNPLGRFIIRVYYAASPTVELFLDYQPLARHATTIFLRNLARAVIRFT